MTAMSRSVMRPELVEMRPEPVEMRPEPVEGQHLTFSRY